MDVFEIPKPFPKFQLESRHLEHIHCKSIKTHEGELGCTVAFAGMEFVPGHYVYSDEVSIVRYYCIINCIVIFVMCVLYFVYTMYSLLANYCAQHTYCAGRYCRERNRTHSIDAYSYLQTLI